MTTQTVPIEPTEAIVRDIASQLSASIADLGFPVGLGVAPPDEMCLKAARGIASLYGRPLAAAPAPSSLAGGEDGRDISGETVMGMRVAAYRHPASCPPGLDKAEWLSFFNGSPPNTYCEHWSTPGEHRTDVERLFTEADVRRILAALSPEAPARDGVDLEGLLTTALTDELQDGGAEVPYSIIAERVAARVADEASAPSCTLTAAAEEALSFLQNAPLESGICCCGDPISGHGYGSGHSPVDDLAYHSSQVAEKLQAALTPRHEAPASEDEARRKLIQCIEQWDGETEYDADDLASLADSILHAFNGPPVVSPAAPVQLSSNPCQLEAPADGAGEAIRAACIAWHEAIGQNPFNVLYRGAWCGSFPHQTGPERWTFTVAAMEKAIDAYLRARSSAPEAREGEAVAGAKALAFFKWARDFFWCEDGCEIDGGDFQDAAERFGLIVKVPFDPERHADNGYGLEAGDDWYETEPAVEHVLSTPGALKGDAK